MYHIPCICSFQSRVLIIIKTKNKRMKIYTKVHLLFQLILFINLYYNTAKAQTRSTSYCGKIRIQPPFSIHSSSSSGNYTHTRTSESESLSTTPLSRLLLCKSKNLYIRTSLGLFPVSSIDYKSKLLTVSHPSSFTSINKFISPSLLSSGFPIPPPLPNSVVLINCSSSSLTRHVLPTIRNCTRFHFDRAEGSSSCLLLVENDVSKLGTNAHFRDNVKCSHYRRVHRRSLNGDRYDGGAYDLGTRISFDIPNHVRNICDECAKPDGHCGVGLRCICHAKECRDEVVNSSPSVNSKRNGIFTTLLCIIIVILIVLDF